MACGRSPRCGDLHDFCRSDGVRPGNLVGIISETKSAGEGKKTAIQFGPAAHNCACHCRGPPGQGIGDHLRCVISYSGVYDDGRRL